MKIRMPEEMTMRQKTRPRDSLLVAALLRFPSMLTPRTIIARARVTNPCAGLSSGQLRQKKPRNNESSEASRNTVNC